MFALKVDADGNELGGVPRAARRAARRLSRLEHHRRR
jgi:hypothetical protein